jgi:hypothetical protein
LVEEAIRSSGLHMDSMVLVVLSMRLVMVGIATKEGQEVLVGGRIIISKISLVPPTSTTLNWEVMGMEEAEGRS